MDMDRQRNNTDHDSADQKMTRDAEMKVTVSTSGEQNGARRMRRYTAERHCTARREVQQRMMAGGTRHEQTLSGCCGENRGAREAGRAAMTAEGRDVAKRPLSQGRI
jgi:hypothetical protein